MAQSTTKISQSSSTKNLFVRSHFTNPRNKPIASKTVFLYKGNSVTAAIAFIPSNFASNYKNCGF